jgi:hypothetical protein
MSMPVETPISGWYCEVPCYSNARTSLTASPLEKVSLNHNLCTMKSVQLPETSSFKYVFLLSITCQVIFVTGLPIGWSRPNFKVRSIKGGNWLVSSLHHYFRYISQNDSACLQDTYALGFPTSYYVFSANCNFGGLVLQDATCGCSWPQHYRCMPQEMTTLIICSKQKINTIKENIK